MSLNFRPETIVSKVARGRVRTVDLQTRRLALNPLLQGGRTQPEVILSKSPSVLTKHEHDYQKQRRD